MADMISNKACKHHPRRALSVSKPYKSYLRKLLNSNPTNSLLSLIAPCMATALLSASLSLPSPHWILPSPLRLPLTLLSYFPSQSPHRPTDPTAECLAMLMHVACTRSSAVSAAPIARTHSPSHLPSMQQELLQLGKVKSTHSDGKIKLILREFASG